MKPGGSSFLIALTQELMGSMNNWYGSENWDYERFGPYESSLKSKAISRLNELFSGTIAIVPANVNRGLIENLLWLENSLGGLDSIYNLLADKSSKSTLVKVLAYRVMGHKNVK